MIRLTLMLGANEVQVPIDTTIVAGWTGRNRDAVEVHIAELEELGVQRPSSSPVFYRVSSSRLSTALEIEATATSSGEVEPVLLKHEGRLWVGVGSDHTDRDVEKYSVAVSKQLCDKPLARSFWLYEEVANHWDHLILRSWIDDDVLYQEDSLVTLLPPDEILRLAEPQLDDGTLMFCGTCASHGGIRPAKTFRYQLADPVLTRKTEGAYRVRPLPLVS
jgi:hypothetical protein